MANVKRIIRKKSNVFADLGFPNPEQELLKAQLTLQIYNIIKARELTQAQAGQILGIKQPHVSTLMRNRALRAHLPPRGRLVLGSAVEIAAPAGRTMRRSNVEEG